MTLGFIRALFVLLSAIVGFQIGSAFQGLNSSWALVGAGAGIAISFVVILIEMGLGKLSLRGLSAAVFGLVLALIISRFLTGAIDLIPDISPVVSSSLKLVIVLVLGYYGMIFTMRGRDEFNLIIPYIKFERQNQRDDVLILDTSVIIDGRILDICQTKFLEGRLVIPGFVLKELQQVADSQDSLKRNRGRRGLDILNKLKKMDNIGVRIQEEDFAGITAVDEKLIKLAKLLGGKVLTNDFNLNKVAELQGVTILNINELAQALRPIMLPGETLEIRLVKEGKEANQCVAYLEDGTMVVVDNSRKFLGQQVSVTVTSVLQTAAGRMIFAKLGDAHPQG